MEKPTKASARLLAVLALAGAAIALIVVVSSSSSTSEDGGTATTERTGKAREQRPQRTRAATYVVQSGDTLTAISHKTGVPAAEIVALNPGIDPQILIVGQTLQLK